MDGKKFMYGAAILLSLIFAVYFSANAAAASPSEKLPKIAWKFQSCWGPLEKVPGTEFETGHGHYVRIIERIKERTGGKFAIKVFNSGELFHPMETLDGASRGSVESAGLYGAYYTGTIPEAFFEGTFPFAVKNYEMIEDLVNNTEYKKIIRETYAKHNIFFVGHINSGLDGFISNFEINRINDIKGHKIRGAGPKAKMIEKLGGSAVPTSGAEIYMALQRGTVDAAWYPYFGAMYEKWYEVAKYLVWPGLTQNAINVLVNMNAWNKLPKTYQDILLEEVNKEFKYSLYKKGPAVDQWTHKGAAEKGMKNIYLTAEEWSKFPEALWPIYENVAKKSDNCSKLLKIHKQVAEKYRDKLPLYCKESME